MFRQRNANHLKRRAFFFECLPETNAIILKAIGRRAATSAEQSYPPLGPIWHVKSTELCFSELGMSG